MVTRHQGSARRAEIVAANEAFLDGVCHVLDELRLMGIDERKLGLVPAPSDLTADALEARLFRPIPVAVPA